MTATPPRLDALTPQARALLEVMAVFYDGAPFGDISKALGLLGHRESVRRAWSGTTVRALAETLIASGHIDPRANCCAPSLREPIARDLVARGEFSRVAGVVRSVSPTLLPLCPSGARAIREFRMVFYDAAKSPAQVAAAWDEWAFVHGCRPLLTMGGLDAAWVAALPPPLLDRLGREAYGQPFATLAAAQSALRLAMEPHLRSGGASPELRIAWAHDLFWRGRTGEIDGVLAGESRPSATVVRARAALVRGDAQTARTAFEEATQQLSKTRQYLDEASALFYATALLALGTTESLKAARAYLVRSERASSVACQHLVYVITHLETGNRPDTYAWYGEGAVSDLRVLFEALARRWTDSPKSPLVQKQLQTFHDVAVTGGHDWIRAETEALLGNPGNGTEGRKTLEDLVQPPPPWRLKLDALARLHQPTAAPTISAPPAPTKAMRMVWLLSLHTSGALLYSPREQKRSGNTWTGGRPIALKRLHDTLGDFDYITDQDRRVLGNIVRSVDHNSRYEDVTYAFRDGPALAALVDHPLLFSAEDGTPVRLGRGEPALLIERVGKNLEVRIDPASTGEWAVRRSAPDAFELVTLSEGHRKIAQILEGTVKFPAGAEKELQAIVEQLSGQVAVHAGIRGWGARSVPADGSLRVQLSSPGNGLRARVVVRPLDPLGPSFPPGDGSAIVVTRSGGEMVQADRALEAERESLDRLLAACPAFAAGSRDAGEWTFDDEHSALSLLLDLGRLADTLPGERVALEWPKDSPVRRVREIHPSNLQLTVRSDGDWLAASGTLRFDDALAVELCDLLALIGDSPGRFIPLGEGRFAALTEELRARLEVLRRLGAQRSGALRLPRVVAPLLDEFSAEGVSIDADASFRALIARITKAESSVPLVPSTFSADLRPYQVDGFSWLARLADRGAGACLADDMGLGKTVQALALLVRRAGDGPALVVAPTSVCAGWLDEARRFAPTLGVRRFGDGDRDAALAGAGPFTVLVCSYGLLQSEVERLSSVRWHTMVLDEAQQIKNSTTQRFKAAIAVGQHADFRMILSGTPIENHLGELWSLQHFLNPGLLGTEPHFRRAFQVPIERAGPAGRSWASGGLRRLIRPFVLRRTKSEVLPDLPPRTEITLQVELGADEAALYEAVRRRAVEAVANASDRGPGWRLQIFAEITRLRQAACNSRLVVEDRVGLTGLDGPAPASAKLAALADLVHSLREGGHKALVFSQFVRHLSIVRELLDERSIPYQYLDGSTSTAERDRAVKAFQSGEGDLFLISLRAGGTGLNLTAADYVIHLDPWWNPAVEDQASDRAHRIGQQRPVTVYRLVAAGTIEERIVALHHQKRDLAASLLEGADGRISPEELLALLMGGGS